MEEPYWLNEAYSDGIDAEGIGILVRNNANVEMVRCLLTTFSRKHRPFWTLEEDMVFLFG